MSVTTDPTLVDRVLLGLVIAALAVFVCDILSVSAVDLAVWILRTVLVELVEWLLG